MENMNNKISSQSYKGARDFYPEDMRLENYIFDTWRKVCKRYGFEEYSFPILEPLEIFAAKTGEEIVNQQLFSFEDRGGRKLAIRPELTPGTVRMIAQKYNEIPQPIKWFMIGNNWRYEKPQMGRGREFYQLEGNIFGVQSVTADFEIMKLIVDIMKEFGANDNMYVINVSDRRLISLLLKDLLKLEEDKATQARRLMDKRAKMEQQDFFKALGDIGLTTEQSQKIEDFMSSDFSNLVKVIPQDILERSEGYLGIQKLFELLDSAGISKYINFDPSIIRGFDYSDGLVYEVFDKNPNNRRSIFGGERFDRLINIFGNYELPATGFAMGDYTLKEFITGWNLLPKVEESDEVYLITLWPDDADMTFFRKSQEIATKLRSKGKNVTMWLEPSTKLEKQMKYADKKNIRYAVIIGDNEIQNNEVTIKDLSTKEQKVIKEIDL